MNTGILLIVCTALISVLLTVSVFTLAALTGFLPRETEEEERSYVLGEAEGRVAVYQADAPDSPLLVTGIDMSSLRRLCGLQRDQGQGQGDRQRHRHDAFLQTAVLFPVRQMGKEVTVALLHSTEMYGTI